MSPKLTAYQIDLDPVHRVIRLTVTAETVTLEMAQEIYLHLMAVTASGGPYAAIHDLSAVKQTTIPTEIVRGFARRTPAIPKAKRPRVIVGEEPAIYGLARVFQICGEAIGSKHEVVHTLEEAYEMVGVRPEDFTERL